MKHKLLFFCSRLGGGGAEMHLARILSVADPNKYEIHLALTRKSGGYESMLPSFINIHYLAENSSSTLSLLLSVLPLKKLIKKVKPEAVISFMDPQNVVVSLLKKYSTKFPPIILCCQNAIQKNLEAGSLRDKFISANIRDCYNRADRLIAISKGVKDELLNDYNIKSPVDVIYNAGFDNSYLDKKEEPLPHGIVKHQIQLVACGRLSKQKGFDVLLETVGILAKKMDVHLWLLGEGPDREKLEKQVGLLNIEKNVQFMGFQKNPYQFFSRSDVFVLSSRWEGFGNVITEAMICGAPVVATNCEFGPNEIITHEENGLLVEVEQPGELADAIEKMITDKLLSEKVIINGRKRAHDFVIKAISGYYFEAIERTIKLNAN
jgi:glycosyltransferase involved in cell wall biosynthesis